MKYLKTFESMSDVSGNLSPLEFANKYNSDYKFIVYIDGKPNSGWEYLFDAIMDGMIDILSIDEEDDWYNFQDNVDIKLGEYGIDINDDSDDIDEGDLNSAIRELTSSLYDGLIEIRLVNSFTEELNSETYLDAADKLDDHGHKNRSRKMRRHAHKFTNGETYFKLGDAVKYVDNISRKEEEYRFDGCKVSRSFRKVRVIFTFISDDNKKSYLNISKSKKGDDNFILGIGDFFGDEGRFAISFSERGEALKFLDFINQNDECVDKLGDLISNIKVNSLYVPK